MNGRQPGFPGGTGITRLNVYTWEAEDGVCGGSPHLHTATSEGYVVIAGRGSVQTLSSQGYREFELGQGTVLWFSPGTVHRLVNADRELDIVAVMGNAGLPENGDAVLTFPPSVLRDPEAYRDAAAVPAIGPSEQRQEAVRARRDLAVAGFAQLRSDVEKRGPEALTELYELSGTLVAEKAAQWRGLVEAGPLAQAQQSMSDVERISNGDVTHLHSSAVATSAATSADPILGMCGTLQTWDLLTPLNSAKDSHEQ